jgi:dinuclear metal center YbgI/SA1388 family protein
MTCLTVTPSTAAEAIRESAGMIVSHHPVLFRGTKQLRADRPETASLWSLVRAGIAVASPHTAFDSAKQGINALICLRLGLIDVKPLRPFASPGQRPSNTVHSPATRYKVVVFTPEQERDAILSAAFGAGGGRIGEYQECSFAIPGEGTFLGTEATNPSVGSRGRRETVRELRLEIVCAADALSRVLTAVRSSHSYEEPAIDVYPLHDATGSGMAGSEGPIGGEPGNALGAGRVGRFVEPRRLDEFAALAGRVLGRVAVQVVGEPNRVVSRVAVACGAGDDFLEDAVKTGADVLLTGEARFHRALEAEAQGIGLVVAGHHATERIGVEELAVLISRSFPGLTVWPSHDEHDPLRWIGAKGW